MRGTAQADEDAPCHVRFEEPAKKTTENEDKVLEAAIKNNKTRQMNGEITMQKTSARLKEIEDERMYCFMESEKCQNCVAEKEDVNMLKGWCREEQGWVRVRSVMDSGCGCSVAPPGMCPTYPIAESEGSKRGQEFVSASEDTVPNLGEQRLQVQLDNGEESMFKYQIADVSRALNSITEICDSGHPDYGHHVVFGRSGGMIVNLETGQQTHFGRDKNIYCLDYWVKPFHRQGR